ncbi:DUF6461 domain-containing protein [Streptosporangium sp. CA-135522]|uniref:DUF6461 domain-containing protein n=1 Tax=Streptosporangium sp. CA-135522 TaxID=3240072 RepID=UPI003D92B9DE
MSAEPAVTSHVPLNVRREPYGVIRIGMGAVVSGAVAADYAWLEEESTDGGGEIGLCLTFVRALPPDEVFRRIGAVPGGAGESVVAAYAARGGTVLEYGWAGMLHHELGSLATGTAVATVFFDIKHDDFTYVVDGRWISSFSPYAYSLREGVVPDPLLADVRELGSIAMSSPTSPSPVLSPWPNVLPGCTCLALTMSGRHWSVRSIRGFRRGSLWTTTCPDGRRMDDDVSGWTTTCPGRHRETGEQ